jgi:hypothetical protein
LELGAHSLRRLESRPASCEKPIYYSAFVPRDGERVADSLPEPFIAFLTQATAATGDGTAALPLELFANAFANTAEEAAAAAFHRQLVPEPLDPIFEPLALPHFQQLGIPSAYISCLQDLALPPGSFHPGQSFSGRKRSLESYSGPRPGARIAAAATGYTRGPCAICSWQRAGFSHWLQSRLLS